MRKSKLVLVVALPLEADIPYAEHLRK